MDGVNRDGLGVFPSHPSGHRGSIFYDSSIHQQQIVASGRAGLGQKSITTQV